MNAKYVSCQTEISIFFLHSAGEKNFSAVDGDLSTKTLKGCSPFHKVIMQQGGSSFLEIKAYEAR